MDCAWVPLPHVDVVPTYKRSDSRVIYTCCFSIFLSPLVVFGLTMGDGKALNAVLRKNASEALFPILRDLGIQAALTHMAGFALHRKTTMKSAKVCMPRLDIVLPDN